MILWIKYVFCVRSVLNCVIDWNTCEYEYSRMWRKLYFPISATILWLIWKLKICNLFFNLILVSFMIVGELMTFFTFLFFLDVLNCFFLSKSCVVEKIWFENFIKTWSILLCIIIIVGYDNLICILIKYFEVDELE